ncbi:putative glutathione transferase [Helianthus anomalus]
MMNDPKKMTIQSVWMEVEAHQFNLPSHKLVIELYINVLHRGREADEGYWWSSSPSWRVCLTCMKNG